MKTPPVLFSQHVHRAELLKLTLPIVQKINVVAVGKPFLSQFSNRDYQAGTKGKDYQAGTKGKGLLSRVWQPG